MKLKINVTLIISFFFVGILFPQITPKTFYLSGGKNLAKISTDVTPNSNGITDMVVLGDTVWLGTNGGISLTIDGGSSWTNFSMESISALAYDKSKGVLWAATVTDTNTSAGVYPRGGGLKYTSDNGKTWTSISQPVDKDSTSDTVIVYGNNIIKALTTTVAVQNVTYDIAFTPGTIWITSWAGGLRKSNDMGKSWQRVLLPLDYQDSVKPSDTLNECYAPIAGKVCTSTNNNLLGFSVVAVDSLTLYVGTAGGLNKSTDGGVSWVKFNHANQTNPIAGNWIVALSYCKYNNTIWAATRRADDAGEIYAASYSSDGGLNWNTTLPNESINNFSVNDNNSVVIAASDDGAFMTSDNGANWISPGVITDAASGISLKTNTFYSAGVNGRDIWLGSGEGLVKLTGTNGGWSGSWKVFTSSKKLTSSSDTYAYPNPFNPRTDILKIKYGTSGSVSVTIRIFDFGMHFVRTVIQSVQRGNSTHVVDNSSGTIDYWDGRDDKGNIVPNGVYFYRVDAGSDKPAYGKILVLH